MYYGKLIYILIIYIILLIILPNGYIKFIPSIPLYPDNNKEVKLVKYYISQRTDNDVKFFKLTDYSVVNAFINIVPESYNNLKKIEDSVQLIILFLKYFINRERPKNIINNLSILNSKTADTPAYPAGHAFQAYYLAKQLSKKYPEKKNLLDNIAKECDLCRIKAGLHYPSDGEFSKYLVDKFIN